MSDHAHTTQPMEERNRLGAASWPLFAGAMSVGGPGLLLAIFLATVSEDGFKRFYFSYLISFCFFLSIGLGALFFVLIQHLTRAGWSASVRRTAEVIAASIPILAALSAPIVVTVAMGKGELYPWARPVLDLAAPTAHGVAGSHAAAGGTGSIAEVERSKRSHGVAVLAASGGHEESGAHGAGAAGHEPGEHAGGHGGHHGLLGKRPYLNQVFFLVRLGFYFLAWSCVGLWYWRQSVKQDDNPDPLITRRMERFSPPAVLLFALTTTFAAFDLLMSLSPEWASTMFGVYFFAGCVVSAMATIILVLKGLQAGGFITRSVSKEHFHDLGKLLFAFTFFWGYIGFSQFMLIWYANLPEETFWYKLRGATTVAADFNDWSYVALLLPICHFALPFAGLLSRHVKRSEQGLVFWAAWMLVFHWVDLWWLVMPEYGPGLHIGLMELATFMGVGGLFAATVIRLGERNRLIAVGDPRLAAALRFQNA